MSMVLRNNKLVEGNSGDEEESPTEVATAIDDDMASSTLGDPIVEETQEVTSEQLEIVEINVAEFVDQSESIHDVSGAANFTTSIEQSDISIEITEGTDAEDIIQIEINEEDDQSDTAVDNVKDDGGAAENMDIESEVFIGESNESITDMPVPEASQAEPTLIETFVDTIASVKMSERGSSRKMKRKDKKEEMVAEQPTITSTVASPQISSISSPSMASTPTESQAHPRRSRAPSPTMVSRIQEKKELSNLNDRLASYIDRVRHLETENRSLTTRIEKYDETQTREVTNVKSLYEKELQDARRLLDQLAKEKTDLRILLDRSAKDAENWKDKYNRIARDLPVAEKKVVSLESQVNDLQARLNDAINQKKHLENENHKLKTDLSILDKKYATLMDQLETETKDRTALQNRLKALEEEYHFKSQLHLQELNETRMRTEITIDEVEGSMISDYDNKLRDALQQMREEYENQIRSTREETELHLLSKMDELRRMASERNNTANTTWDELKNVRAEIDELRILKKTLLSKLTQSETLNDELMAELQREKLAHDGDVLNRDAEIKRLEIMIADQLEEYKDLMDIKVALDLEISNYRKLLESEETRLNISSSGDTSKITPTRLPGSAGRKRKRMHIDDEVSFIGKSTGSDSQLNYESTQKNSNFEISTTASGVLEVQETDEEGKYVKIYNTSNEKEMAIGGYSIVHQAGEDETIFKFHRTIHVAPNSTVTVWSSESEGNHSPPHDLLMNTQRWFLANEMKTQLLDPDGGEVACRTMKKRQTRASFFSSSVTEGVILKKYRERLLYPEVDADRLENERCSIM